MESVLLDTPDGISVRLGWDPKMSEHDRKRVLAREVLAARLGREPGDVRITGEAPSESGFHTQLTAEVDGAPVPLSIRDASFRAATIVAVADPDVKFGIDIRDTHPDETTLGHMRRHSHLLDEADATAVLLHWTRSEAIRDADGRGHRAQADKVRLNSPRTKGWISDRKVDYTLTDLSRDGWIITLAHVSAG